MDTNDRERKVFVSLTKKVFWAILQEVKTRSGLAMADVEFQFCVDRGMETYRNMGVSGISLGVCGREDGVNQHKGAHNLSSKPVSFRVAMGHTVSTPTDALVECRLEALHNPCSTNGPQALTHDVQH